MQEKIEYIFKILRTVQNVPKKFFAHMTGTDGIYEMRTEFERNIYSLDSNGDCCFDKGDIVVLFNGFQKKSQRMSKTETDLTLKLKNEYFNSKKKK